MTIITMVILNSDSVFCVWECFNVNFSSYLYGQWHTLIRLRFKYKYVPYKSTTAAAAAATTKWVQWCSGRVSDS